MNAVKVPAQNQTAVQVARRGLIKDPKIESCIVCGRDFLKTSSQKKTCSPACSHVNAMINLEKRKQKDPEGAKEKAREYSRKWRKEHPQAFCKICGGAIWRGDSGRSRTQMHEKCVYDDCLKTLRSGKELSKMQYLRLQARGWTLKEFKEEYLNVQNI